MVPDQLNLLWCDPGTPTTEVALLSQHFGMLRPIYANLSKGKHTLAVAM